MVTGIQGMLLQDQNLIDNIQPALALTLTAFVGLFISYKLFRWEKEEKIRPAAKLWLAAVLTPFLILGFWQVHAGTGVAQTKILNRQLARGDTFLIRGARIFIGDGKVIENGSVLVRAGKIAEIYEGEGPDPKTLKAETVEAAGKTILPGLIDVHIHLGAPGGMVEETGDYDRDGAARRELAAYLYSGVTTVRSVGDLLESMLKLRKLVGSGEVLGADLQTCGPLFTAAGGHGTEYFKGLPANVESDLVKQFTRIPTSAAEARQQVDQLKSQDADCVKAVLETGAGGRVFNRMDTGLFKAVALAAHADSLPLSVHTGEAHDVSDAVDAQANSIEHGSFRDKIPDAVFEQMAKQGTAYDPTLSVGEAFKNFAAGKSDLLKRSLVQQVGPAELLQGTEQALESSSKEMVERRKSMGQFPTDMAVASDNLKRAYQHGVPLVTGSDAGNLLVVHGPTVQHEMQLWVQAGIPAAVALQAATLNAARLLRIDNHVGLVKTGADADLLVVDGNPLEDITATERISLVVFKGERVDRAELFNQR
jgi:imidazolonepropionase-like amidohydrolase